MKDIFGRLTLNGDVDLFWEDGNVLTRLETSSPVYCVDDDLGTAYEHPNGLVITRQDAERLGIETV